jgi:quinoprotein relay system zinc metallohydrolase 2
MAYRTLITLATLISAPMAIAAGNAVGDRVARLVEVATGVYVRPGKHSVVFEGEDIANIGFVVGQRCVAVIDTGGSYSEGQALLRAIRQITSLPVRYVINTHVHPDHILGNLAFKGLNTTFIGHARLPRAMAMLGGFYLERASAQTEQRLPPEAIVLPDRVVDQELVLDLGERILMITAHAGAHTDNDLSVYDQATGTLWLSDLLFIGHIPVIDNSVLGWIRVVEELEEQPAERVVPGHGPPQAPWPAAAADLKRYLKTLRDETRAWIGGHGDLRTAEERIGYTESDRWKLFAEYHRRNVTAAFTELEWED